MSEERLTQLESAERERDELLLRESELLAALRAYDAVERLPYPLRAALYGVEMTDAVIPIAARPAAHELWLALGLLAQATDQRRAFLSGRQRR